MRAATYTEYGGPEQVRVEEIPSPQPGAGEVLLDVHAAGCNPYDSHFLHGEPGFMRLFIGLRRPRSNRLGKDVAGVVAALGPGVTGFKVGDEVYGGARGAFAEQAVAKVKEIAPKPTSISWAEAAAIPMAAFTGLQGLKEAGFSAGQTVLINGASGGIGHFCVQLAKQQGCIVTASCKTSNVTWVRELGADRVIDYTQESIFDVDLPFDVIVDSVANGPVSQFLDITKRGGAYVWLGSADMHGWFGPLGRMLRLGLGPRRGRRALSINARRSREDLEELSAMVTAGTLRVVIEQQFSLDETAKAIAHMRAGHTKGKTVVVVR